MIQEWEPQFRENHASTHRPPGALDIFRMKYINASPMRSRPTMHFAVSALLALLAVVFLASVADAAELVMYRRDGCPWCAKWDREIGPIYPKTEFNRLAPLRVVNLDRDPDRAIAHAPIHYTPTFVLVDDGREVGRIEGYPGDEFFWARLEGLVQRLPVRRPPKVTSVFDSGLAATAERM